MYSFLSKSINRRDIVLSFILLISLFIFYGSNLWKLLSVQDINSDTTSITEVLFDPYIQHVIYFSFFQALLSAVLSILLGLVTAHALFYQDFFGKRWLIRLFSLSMVLPVLVAIFGLLGVYGQSGWLASLTEILHINWKPNIYGLTGILLAHIFFNIPLSAKVFLTSLESIPNQQQKLAAQLGVKGWNFIRLVEIPYLRSVIPSLFVLVFMLCFTSFTVVLIMGGSPKYTTLEVAIYQALVFDFELQKGAVIALIQFIFCFMLFGLSNLCTKITETVANVSEYRKPLGKFLNILHSIILISVVSFLILPLLSILIDALNMQAWISALKNTQLVKALLFSLSIALCAGMLCVFMSLILLLGARQFYFLGILTDNKSNLIANGMVSVGMMVLAVPTLVLAVGMFLWLRSFEISVAGLFIIVVICNALMAMPFSLRILAQPLYNNMIYYHRLCQSLGIVGWSRFRLIEWQSIRKPLSSALALAIALSLGDFTAIALFGNAEFTSLPHFLYQQLGNYRSNDASVTAFILLILCTTIFLLVEQDK